MSVKSTTVRLNTDTDPVWIGARSGLLWHRSDLTLAGMGEAKRIAFQRPDGVEDAMAQLAEIDQTSDEYILGPGRGLVAFSALPFAPEAPGELIVPELVVGQDRSGRRWLTVVDDVNLSAEEARDRLESRVQTLKSETTPGSVSNYSIRAEPAPDIWRDDVVRVARDSIVAGELVKAVMARRLVVTTDQQIDSGEVVHNLVGLFPTAVVFNIEGFVGASPELLVARSDDMVHSHPLAGTAPRSSEPSIDTRLIAELLASTKDRWEHKITIDWLLDTLLPFCSYVDAEPEPSVVTLANVHHLGTMVEGRLSRPHPSVLELVSALHPTPAVGGAPQSTALDLIDKLEGESRHQYAGPTGWVDGQGNGSFVVAIRSAEIVGTTATLRAGVGVVADSDPSAELEETKTKFRAMLSALIRP